jgi:hypothetical protein
MRVFAVALGCILAIRFVAPSAAEPQTRPKAASSCDHVELLSSHPLSALPNGTQDILQRSLRSKVLAITSDPKMGMSDADVAKARLKAIEIARPSKASALYVVAWEDNAFGVNGFNWIIEVKPSGATSLLSDRASSIANGFGVKVLGNGAKSYPKIMIASKGFRDGGGAEAEPGCFRKIGRLYESTSCPVSCKDEVNNQ